MRPYKFYLDGSDHMRKHALTLTCTACVFGAFGIFCRWIQGMSAFEENGLYITGNLWGIILIIMYIAAFGSLLGFCIFFKKRETLASPPEFGLATAGNTRIALPIAALFALIMAGGSAALLITAGQEQLAKLLRVLALLGIFLACGFMGMAGSNGKSSPRGSALEAGLCLASALPVACCCFWLVVSYRQDAATSVVWSYAPEIIALASSLLAFYYLAGHAYGRPRPFAAIFFCEFGAFSCFVTLPDSRLMALHLHDNGGERRQHSLPFDGELDWPSTMEAIAQTGYQGATSLEPMNWGYEALSPEEFLCAAVERARQLASLRGPAAF